MTEIGGITMPEALSCLHLFITLKNLRTLLCFTLFFWHCCYQADPSPSVVAPVSTPSPVVAYPTDTSTFFPLQVPISHNYSAWLTILLQSLVTATSYINKIHAVKYPKKLAIKFPFSSQTNLKKSSNWQWNHCNRGGSSFSHDVLNWSQIGAKLVERSQLECLIWWIAIRDYTFKTA
jgi:hypothetical protein